MPAFLQSHLQTQIGHHRAHHRLVRQPSPAQQSQGANAQNMVAICHPAGVVRHDTAVAVTVEGDPQVGPVALYQGDHDLRMGGAAHAVDILAVGPHSDGDDLRPQLDEDLRRHLVGGPMGAIDHDLEAVQLQFPGEGALQKGDIAAAGIVDAEGLADLGGCGPGPLYLRIGHQLLHVGFYLIGQLETISGKELDAVVLIGIVGGGNDHPGVGSHRGSDEGDSRGGQRTQKQCIHPHGTDACGDGILQEVTGNAGVLAHHDVFPPGAVFNDVSQDPSQLQGHLRGHGMDVGHPPNPVGAEKMTRLVHFPSHFAVILASAAPASNIYHNCREMAASYLGEAVIPGWSNGCTAPDRRQWLPGFYLPSRRRG